MIKIFLFTLFILFFCEAAHLRFSVELFRHGARGSFNKLWNCNKWGIMTGE